LQTSKSSSSLSSPPTSMPVAMQTFPTPVSIPTTAITPNPFSKNTSTFQSNYIGFQNPFGQYQYKR
jgi:hypothetical protein